MILAGALSLHKERAPAPPKKDEGGKYLSFKLELKHEELFRADSETVGIGTNRADAVKALSIV